jgi:hypothetical protein
LWFIQSRHLCAIDRDPACISREDTSNQMKKGGFPRPAFAAQRHLLAGRERE